MRLLPVLATLMLATAAPALSAPARDASADHDASATAWYAPKRSEGAIPPAGAPPLRSVVLYSGRLIERRQFVFRDPDECLTYHFHAVNGVSVTALDGTVIPDPMPCGYNLPGDDPFFSVFDIAPLPDADFDGIPDLFDAAPGNPDANGDSRPDGVEDSDGDGLSNAEEYWLSGTDLFIADTDGDGIPDLDDYVLETTARESAVIPVVVNLYQGSGATPQQARDAVVQANRVLKQDKVMLLPVKVNENVTAGDNGDGIFTPAEGANVMYNGLAGVAALPGTKGLSVSFAAPGGVEVGSPTPGLSFLRHGSVICSQRASAALSGTTIVHELLHTLTLDHPGTGSREDTPGNAMTPANAGRDTFVISSDPDKGIANVTLTPAQRAQIRRAGIASQIGVSGTQNSPARKREYESGLVVDPRADRTVGQPDYLELTQIQAASDETRDTIQILISLAGRFPASGEYLAFYRVLFDIDNNPGTGNEGGTGFDVEAQVIITRSAAGGFEAFLRRFDTSANGTPLFPFPEVHAIAIRADDGTYTPGVLGDLIELRIEKSELGLTADAVSVRILARASEFGSTVDSANFVYDRKRWQKDPTMTLQQESAGAGQLVAFALSGLTANATFEFRLDDTVLFSATLDASGAYAGSFVAPAQAVQPFRFLTALDPTGRFAFGGILVQSEIFRDSFENR